MSALLNFFRSAHSQRAFAGVRAETRADDILRVLTVRGFDIAGAGREAIQSCTDLEILGDWLDGALTVPSAVDLFHLVSEKPNFCYCSEVGQRAFTDVRLESRPDDILRILKARGLEVTAETRERVRACRDLDLLRTWLDRAVTASRAEELFTDG